MKSNTILYLAAAGVALWVLTRKAAPVGACRRIGAMTDTPVSLDNIRKGVARGWYKADAVFYVFGTPSVRLSGKDTTGTMYSDVYPITQATYDALVADGIPTV